MAIDLSEIELSNGFHLLCKVILFQKKDVNTNRNVKDVSLRTFYRFLIEL